MLCRSVLCRLVFPGIQGPHRSNEFRGWEGSAAKEKAALERWLPTCVGNHARVGRDDL